MSYTGGTMSTTRHPIMDQVLETPGAPSIKMAELGPVRQVHA